MGNDWMRGQLIAVLLLCSCATPVTTGVSQYGEYYSSSEVGKAIDCFVAEYEKEYGLKPDFSGLRIIWRDGNNVVTDTGIEVGGFARSPYLIEVPARLDKQLWRTALFHELCHVASWRRGLFPDTGMHSLPHWDEVKNRNVIDNTRRCMGAI